jgi:deazaflavin-dependent oxidoreductase (nitroreductase family)
MMVEPRVYNPEFLYLTTTGRKSGKPHEIEIWYVPHSHCYYLISGGGEASHWVRNIQHHPQVSFWVQGQSYNGTGRTINSKNEPELAATIAELMKAKYKWSEGLIVELCAG